MAAGVRARRRCWSGDISSGLLRVSPAQPEGLRGAGARSAPPQKHLPLTQPSLLATRVRRGTSPPRRQTDITGGEQKVVPAAQPGLGLHARGFPGPRRRRAEALLLQPRPSRAGQLAAAQAAVKLPWRVGTPSCHGP